MLKKKRIWDALLMKWYLRLIEDPFQIDYSFGSIIDKRKSSFE